MKRRWPLPLLTLGYLAALLLVLATPWAQNGTVTAGAPSPRDFTAPRAQRYISELRSSAERERAAQAVPPAYRLDMALGDTQRQRSAEVLANIDLLRQSPETTEQKRQWVAGFPEFAGLSAEAVAQLVEGEAPGGMATADWESLRQEVPRLVGQVMRQYIRSEDLTAVRSEMGAVVDPRLDANTARLAGDLAAAFVVPNRIPDEAAIAGRQRQARAAAEDVVVQVQTGSTIVRKGDLVTPEAYEALSALGLLPRVLDGRQLLSLALSLVALVAVLGVALHHLNPPLFSRPGALAFIVLLDLAFTAAARLVQGLHPLALYAVPASAVAMTLAVVFSLGTGFVSAMLLAATVGLIEGAGLGPALYVLLGGLAGAIIMVRVARLKAFVWAGLILSLLNAALALAQVLAVSTDPRELALAAGLGVAQALVATGLAALGILAVGTLFGVATPFHLYELMRPDHPLVRELQIQAPGTYQHSMVLANLVEAAAAAIGADALLVRAGAYFHDVGKTVRPAFFVENQLGGGSAHEGLAPADSARIILDHVTDGLDLLRRHRLPDRLLDFVREHHGTTRVEYFYRRALEADPRSADDEARFRYPGPRPQSRETAILMLADGAEASVRAAEAGGAAAIDAVVAKVIQARVEAGQLDDSGLSLGDLQRIRASFVDTLRGMYHPRVRYPEGIQPLSEPAPAGEGPSALAPRSTKASER